MPDEVRCPIPRQDPAAQAWFARLRALGKDATSPKGLKELARLYHCERHS